MSLPLQRETIDRGALREAPALAIVIPCYNYEAFVGQAIESVTSQRNAAVELIVVDDGSSDGSWDVISAMARAEARSGRPFDAHRIANSGARAACLFGVDRSAAPFILFLDADDALLPGSLETILANLDKDVAKLQFPLERIDARGAPLGPPRPALRDARERGALAAQVLRAGVYVSPPTSGNVFRRDLCELLREAAYEPWVDGVMLFAAPFMGDVVSLSKPLGLYRLHADNDSGLSKAPDRARIARELARFASRMDHLGQVLARSGVEEPLVRTEDAYYHLERSLYLALASGRRPPPGLAARLVRRLWSEPHGVRAKLALTTFVTLSALLPPLAGQRALAWRFGVGERTPRGFVKAVAGR